MKMLFEVSLLEVEITELVLQILQLEEEWIILFLPLILLFLDEKQI